jgi:PAS domain S-box-containing protein
MGAEKTTFQNRELQKTIKYFPGPCLLLTTEGYILAASEALHQVSGTDESIIGRLLFDVFPENPESAHVNAVSSLQHSFSMAVKKKEPHHMPLQRYDIPKGGNPSEGFIQKFWKAVNVPILDERGEVMFILHKTEDITEHIEDKQQIADLTAHTKELLLQEQAALREAEQQRAYAFDLLMQSPIAICIFQGTNYVVELVNKGMLEIWGCTHEDVLGKPFFEAKPEVRGQGFEEILAKVYTTGQTLVDTGSVNLFRHGELQKAYFQIVYQPFRNLHGMITGIIFANTEITGQVEAQRQLEQIMQDLKDRNFELDQFVYKTSHDLRAPLMTILGLVNLIKGQSLPDSVAQYMDMIESRVYKLDGFIKSTLDYSRNTRTDVSVEQVDLQSILTEILSGLELMKNFDRLTISTWIQEGIFYSDAFRVRIVLSNLLSNAIKYQDISKKEGWLKIKVKVNPKRVIIHLKDNGMGIDTSYQDAIFGMFVRATDQSEGSGLGLYIVKQAVVALKGRIELRSRLGEGTDFVITLPNKKAP